MFTCSDCGKNVKKGRPAAILPDGARTMICQNCWKEWVAYMHKGDCTCDHCVSQRSAA